MMNSDIQENVDQQDAGLNSNVGIPVLEDIPEKIDKSVLDIIPEETAKRFQTIAFARTGRSVKVAMVDPHDIDALNVLRFLAENNDLDVEVYAITEHNFEELSSKYSSPEKTVREALESIKGMDVDEINFKSHDQEEEEKVSETIQDAPISKLVQVIIRHAIDGRASDIHIEPTEGEYRVRYRIDGILHASLVFPKEVGRAVLSRIKILSSLKIDEKRKPQDGRFKVVEANKSIDFRVSTLPVIEGEKVVMRVLDKSSGIFDFKSLGLMGRSGEILLKKLKDTYGIILITGPTGSGKSTTLYSFLKILNQEERNIITLEDPVEYFIEGINQSQIKPEIGYTFANGLRSILRQDPNVIMVGEIRDGETAELAIHAALTGHLVFSTLHTNNAVGAIPRLIDMGIEPFLLSSSLRAVAAQRLVRRICENCKEEMKISDYVRDKVREVLDGIGAEELKKYELESIDNPVFYKGKGCEECNGLGLRGRLAIYETVDVDAAIQDIITEKSGNEGALRDAVKKQGMVSLKQDGVLKAIKGLTTLAEVERVTEGSFSIGGDVEDDKG